MASTSPGLSPRGRGTPRPGRRRSPIPRFIPAWAGNAIEHHILDERAPVHPRVGGERAAVSGLASVKNGSSPRGRGTLQRPARARDVHRFIPAWAGNACPSGRAGRSRAVHPRVGGERVPVVSMSMVRIGSSPRGRGTRARRRGRSPRPRFIPAWAGNAGRRRVPAQRGPVHPRVGGERDGFAALICAETGSSPRGRGTPRVRRRARVARRFIPAWAGNAPCRPACGSWPPVHPRVGGEREIKTSSRSCRPGSSPRGRGTRSAVRPSNQPSRFIPAWAGNADKTRSTPHQTPVHPRVGGERRSSCPCRPPVSGSYPRGRGTPLAQTAPTGPRRFIPAWAGNASATNSPGSPSAVHPRVGGERAPAPLPLLPLPGSSPRGRGTRVNSRNGPRRGRFIPAWAGNAAPSWRTTRVRSVHPRVGGERRLAPAGRPLVVGSSPRGRGTQPSAALVGLGSRFIPAWAGNAPLPLPRPCRVAVHPRVGGERARV